MKTWQTRLIAFATAGALLTSVTATASAQVGGTITRAAVPISATLPAVSWESHWAHPDLTALIDLGVIRSREALPAPEQAVTVSQAARLLLQLTDADAAGGAVEAAVAAGLIKPADLGVSELHPEGAVAREVFALWLCRATGQQMMAEFAKILMHPDFIDAPQIDGRFRNAVALLQQQGIFQGNGDGTFAPQRALTVAESYRMAHMVLQAK